MAVELKTFRNPRVLKQNTVVGKLTLDGTRAHVYVLVPLGAVTVAGHLTALAAIILVTRPLSGRLGDRFGYRRVFLPCLVLITIGLACLVFGGTRFWLVTSAMTWAPT